MGAVDRDSGEEGAMPPWHADPAIGHFANARRLTERAEDDDRPLGGDRRARGGCRKTCRRRPSTPRAGRSARPMRCSRCRRTIRIPAAGEIPYLYFEVPTNFDEDRWIRSWEVRPGNPAAVHHVIVYLRPQPDPTAASRDPRRARRGRRASSRSPRGWTSRPARPAAIRCRRISARSSRTIARGRAGPPGRSADSCPETVRASSPPVRPFVCPRAPRSSSRCTTPRRASRRRTGRRWASSSRRSLRRWHSVARRSSTARCTSRPARRITASMRR